MPRLHKELSRLASRFLPDMQPAAPRSLCVCVVVPHRRRVGPSRRRRRRVRRTSQVHHYSPGQSLLKGALGIAEPSAVRSRSTYFCAKHHRIAARRGARWANRRLEKLVDILRFSKSVGYRDERYFAAKSNFVPGAGRVRHAEERLARQAGWPGSQPRWPQRLRDHELTLHHRSPLKAVIRRLALRTVWTVWTRRSSVLRTDCGRPGRHHRAHPP